MPNNQRTRPFGNSKTKSRFDSINCLEIEDQHIDEVHDDDPTTYPEIATLIDEQHKFENGFTQNEDDDIVTPVVCAIIQNINFDTDDYKWRDILQQHRYFETVFNPQDHIHNEMIISSANRDDTNEPPISSRAPNQLVNEIVHNTIHIESVTETPVRESENTRRIAHRLPLRTSDPSRMIDTPNVDIDSSGTSNTTSISSLTDAGTITSNENGDVNDNSDDCTGPTVQTINNMMIISASINNNGNYVPVHHPFEYRPITRSIVNIADCTPTTLRSSISRIHQKCNFEPKQILLQTPCYSNITTK